MRKGSAKSVIKRWEVLYNMCVDLDFMNILSFSLAKYARWYYKEGVK